MNWLVLFCIPETGVEANRDYYCSGAILDIHQNKSDIVGLVHYNFS